MLWQSPHLGEAKTQPPSWPGRAVEESRSCNIICPLLLLVRLWELKGLQQIEAIMYE